MGIHASLHGSPLVIFEGIGGHGYDRNGKCMRRRGSSYGLGSFIAVHYRHLYIHEHHIKFIRTGRDELLDNFLSVIGYCALHSYCIQQLHNNLSIDFIVFSNKDLDSAERVTILHFPFLISVEIAIKGMLESGKEEGLWQQDINSSRSCALLNICHIVRR